jgi:glycerol-3-phosphate acyltransferase PlsY
MPIYNRYGGCKAALFICLVVLLLDNWVTLVFLDIFYFILFYLDFKMWWKSDSRQQLIAFFFFSLSNEASEKYSGIFFLNFTIFFNEDKDWELRLR